MSDQCKRCKELKHLVQDLDFTITVLEGDVAKEKRWASRRTREAGEALAAIVAAREALRAGNAEEALRILEEKEGDDGYAD